MYERGCFYMIKFKINVSDALENIGFTSYKAKTSRLLSQDTLKRVKNGDTNISLQSLNNLCLILDMELSELIIFDMSEQERELRKKYL